MQIPKKAICQFYLKGKCKFGENCKCIHPGNITPMISNLPAPNPYSPHDAFMKNYQYPNSLNLCKYFIKGKCTKDKCSFYHGFSDTLQTLQTKKAHDNEIIDLVALNNEIFITCDIAGFIAWKLDPKLDIVEEKKIEEGTICKLIVSNGRIIIASKVESMYGFIFQLFV